MKRVLMYKNRKADPVVWDTTDDVVREQAFLSLFRYLKDEWEVYVDLTEPPIETHPRCDHDCHMHQSESIPGEGATAPARMTGKHYKSLCEALEEALRAVQLVRMELTDRERGEG